MSLDLSKVLITGGDGMLGSYINFGIKTDQKNLNITNLDEIVSATEKYKPEAVLHLAAETDLEECEREPAHAYLVNAVGTYNIALAARNFGAKMVYMSTAGVFGGDKENYSESDFPNPTDHYGHSKYLGELAVKSLSDDYLILRVSWLMGGGPEKDKKFVGKIMKKLAEGEGEINAVTDRLSNPTFAKDAANAIKILLEKNESGVFHISNKGGASRYDMAKFIVDFFKLDVSLRPVDSSFFNFDAKRVKNETLSSKLNIMRPWQEALAEYLEMEWNDYFYAKRRN